MYFSFLIFSVVAKVAESHAVFSAKLLAAKDNLASHSTALAKVEVAALAREKSLLVRIVAAKWLSYQT